MKRKAIIVSLFSASSRKKQWISLESVAPVPAGNETVPSATGSPGAEEPAAMEGTSAAGPTTGLAGPTTDLLLAWKVLKWLGLVLEAKERVLLALALVAWRWASAAVRALASVKKLPQRWRISVVLVARKLLLRLLLLILLQGPLKTFYIGDFAEDWLETLDKNEIKSISLFLCYHFVHAFFFIETKAAEYAASMMKKSDRTARRWRSALIDDVVLPELEQGRYQRSGVLWQNEELNKKAVEYV